MAAGHGAVTRAARRTSAWDRAAPPSVVGPRRRWQPGRGPGRGRAGGALVIAAVLAVLGAGAALGATAPTGDPVVACRPITLITVAGHGADSAAALAAVAGPLAARAPALAVVDVPGPAGPAYPAAEPDAARDLEGRVAELARRCPAGRVLLLGASEGAHVVGDLASRLGTGRSHALAAERVLAVGLLGDPARDPATRTVPEGASGYGVLAPRPGGFGALSARTIEICAPADPVCDGPAGRAPDSLVPALGAAAHAHYATVDVVPGTPATRWAQESLAAVVAHATARPVTRSAPRRPPRSGRPAPGSTSPTTTAPATTAPSTTAPTTTAPTTTAPPPTTTGPATTTPATTSPGTTTPAPTTSPAADTAPPGPDAAPAGAGPGATWSLTDGLAGFKATPWNHEGAPEPAGATSPERPGRQAVRFDMPAGGKRAEAEPDVGDFTPGQRVFLGMRGRFADGFPVDTESWQLIAQFKQGSPGSPPLAVEVGRGQLRLANHGTAQRDFCPVRAGAPFSFRLGITFGAGIDAWCGDRQVLTDYHPPAPTIDGRAYLKTGIYRDPSIPTPATLYLDDLALGPDLASVSGGTPDAAPSSSRAAPADPTAPPVAGEDGGPAGPRVCETFGSAPVAGGHYRVQNNEWGAHDGQCVTPTASGFRVDGGAHHRTDGPAAYPSMVAGCWMGTCTAGTTLPRRLGELGALRSSLAGEIPPGTRTNLAYDLWVDRTPRRDGPNDTLELMVWLRADGGVAPIGSPTGTVRLGDADWEVWRGSNGGVPVLSYVRRGAVDAVDGLPLGDFLRDAVGRGGAPSGAYLTTVQAGFEPWTGGPGLAVRRFSVDEGTAAPAP